MEKVSCLLHHLVMHLLVKEINHWTALHQGQTRLDSHSNQPKQQIWVV